MEGGGTGHLCRGTQGLTAQSCVPVGTTKKAQPGASSQLDGFTRYAYKADPEDKRMKPKVRMCAREMRLCL
jgi:hypothetical protein